MANNEYDIEIVSWNSHRETLHQIRHQVFVEEQQVPSDIEMDGHDGSATHFLVSAKHAALGCGRLLEDGKITRLALLAEHRGAGIGAALLARIVEHALSCDLSRVYLHAQDHAAAFYEKAGFIREGEGFEEAGIAHHVMALDLLATAGVQPLNGVSYPEPFASLAVQLVAGANRQLRIFSPQLDHAVFDRESMVDAVSALARNSRYCDIRILICDSRLIVKQGHRLLTLARRLPSSIHIQKLAKHPDLPTDSFVICDSNAIIYKPLDADKEGFCEPDSAATAKRFIDKFDELWHRSTADRELRILGI